MSIEYEKQANDFLKKTSTMLKAEFNKFDFHFPGDKERRDIYDITLTKTSYTTIQSLGDLQSNKQKTVKDYTFKFGQSTAGSDAGKRPTTYDVLTCLTTCDPESFEDFCGNYGYDTDSRQAEKVYRAVKEEYLSLKELYTDDELELLSEIN